MLIIALVLSLDSTKADLNASLFKTFGMFDLIIQHYDEIGMTENKEKYKRSALNRSINLFYK